ncbi:MAG: type I DNA topoisomerase [Clostridia bacterium]|nr:type I DNA topoisomerase [Clostridia bacterium]
MKLVVIEGPGKRETLKKYLGAGYEVFASKGHVRDLPAKELAVDLNHNFEPKYEILPDKKDVVADLKKKAQKADEILLATDPDREGEAISWHLAHILGIKPDAKCRIEFNEISKDAVQAALKNPRTINQSLVDAQQARRVLDRIVGYKLSPIICKAVKPKLSAGRVQSIALKLIVDREKEIRDFKPEEYWTVAADLKKDQNSTVFKAQLATHNGKKIKPANKEDVDQITAHLNDAKFVVKSIKKSKTKSNAMPPYTTSTMQQDALNKLGFSLAKSSQVAQVLYEGVDLKDHGKTALITYIRTDSTRVSEGAQKSAREYILDKFGKDFVPTKPNVYTTKKSAQDAHEAIRPINVNLTPEMVKPSLKDEVYKLYKLIYERFLASQMTPAQYDSVAVEIEAGDYGFKATGRTLTFEGYTVIYKGYTEKEDEADGVKIPKLDEGDLLNLVKLNTEQKFTKPPARFTEASLVKAMEEKGIGRPATYTPTITTLAYRNYTQKDGKALKPTELGEVVSDYLDKYFKGVINVKFTANMESRLDDIAENTDKWQDVIASFWNGFKGLLLGADKSSVGFKQKPVETDEVCELCGAKMVIREGRYGKFLGCANYPNCKNIKSLNKQPDAKPVGVCPDCGKPVVARKSKRGKIFYSCSGYPDCKFMSWDIPTADKCANCGGVIYKKVLKDKFSFYCANKCGVEIPDQPRKEEGEE